MTDPEFPDLPEPPPPEPPEPPEPPPLYMFAKLFNVRELPSVLEFSFNI
jgi:hypothetical protein